MRANPRFGGAPLGVHTSGSSRSLRYGCLDASLGESCESGASAECGIDGEESEGDWEMLMVVEVEVSAVVGRALVGSVVEGSGVEGAELVQDSVVEGSGVMDGDVGLSSSS